jgi:RNA polymerase primary sigma factor
MTQVLDNNLWTNLDADDHEEKSAMLLLVQLGQTQGHVSLTDILRFFPTAEKNTEKLEDAFAALLTAGIPYLEDAPSGPNHKELEEEEDESGDNDDDDMPVDYLANIDPDDSIGLYLKEASRVPLLTAEEELDLSQRIERGRLAREEMAKGKVSPVRQKELRFLVDDGWAAREHLITANSRLVISVAKKYIGRGVPFLDLIQEGNIGLMRAAKKFDHRRGFKFSTYATWWIRQAVSRAVADQGRTIRVPVHMGDQISRMLRTQHKLKQVLGRDPSVEEMADALETTPDKVEYLMQVSRRPLSLQMPIGEEEDDTLGDFIEDKDVLKPDDSANQNLLREHLQEVLEKLPAREARILQLRYGLLDGQELTLNEVGRKMGVTRERVRQIEAQALRRLRSLSLHSELRTYVDDGP